MKHHGVASGVFTCDEHLNGASPTQGTETCTVVELMYSIETLIGLGDYGAELPDILERAAYDAAAGGNGPPDMSGHQYDQQANQSEGARSTSGSGTTTATSSSNPFGFEPNFGCCTANYHQGWPKFVSHLWYATNDGGLSAVSYAPCTVRTALGGVPVRLKVSGGYPFAQTVRIEVAVKQPAEFPLYLRVPYWARQPMIYLPDGEIMQVRANETTCVRRKWRTGDVVRLEMPAAPRLTRWDHQSGAVEFGPLLMALQPKEDWLKLRRKRRLAGDHGRCVELGAFARRADEGGRRGRAGDGVRQGRAVRQGAGQGRAGGMGDGRRERRQRADGARAAGRRRR